jgi:retron-type reverse transcriptase
MDTKEWLARNLAAALLAGAWTQRALESRAARFLGDSTRKSQRRLLRELANSVASEYPPAPEWLVRFFLATPSFEKAISPLRRGGRWPHAVLDPPRFVPASAFANLPVPRVATPGELADWLGISVDELDWFADSRRQHAATARPILQHYFYAFADKRAGPPRLIEAPKPRLKAIQGRILREILDPVPPHEHAHGFVRGRSCLSGARVHAGEFVVVAVDLKEFFPSIRLSRVHALFRSLGYPWAVARLLTGLCSTCTPAHVFLRVPEARRHDWRTRKLYASPHLAQGAPTSPALANLIAWRLDRRTSGFARVLGANYTRYADDLTFSGDESFARRIKSLLAGVEAIARDEGFRLNREKTRIMRRSASQRVTGIVVNQHLNVPRVDYDQLKATLHNCARNGPEQENRDGLADFAAHLAGRVLWVESLNPRRGVRLRKLYEKIDWSAVRPASPPSP